MKKGFKAVLKVGGKEQAFAKSADSVPSLIVELKKNGLNLSQVVRFEEFDILDEKVRGKAASKY